MRYVNGRVLKDPTLPGVIPTERREIYSAMCRVLADIHHMDIEKAQLQDFGKHGTICTSNYCHHAIVVLSHKHKSNYAIFLAKVDWLYGNNFNSRSSSSFDVGVGRADR